MVVFFFASRVGGPTAEQRSPASLSKSSSPAPPQTWLFFVILSYKQRLLIMN